MIGGRYSGEARTKLLVRSICVSRQLAVSNYSVWTGDVLHTFTVLKLYMWFIISFIFAIHSPISWMFVIISLMNCANVIYQVSAVPVFDCVGMSCFVVNNWYYCYIVCNDACMNLQYLNVFKYQQRFTYSIFINISRLQVKLIIAPDQDRY